ncbi:hypothetical protein NJ7G_1025 [Natrinema sp. J7-2]|nr:hypothetical protein NJ7G_1025 [Natrinema sp. J7-2]
MSELFKPLSDARPTADPRVMEAADPHFKGMKSRFDVVSINIAEVIAQS